MWVDYLDFDDEIQALQYAIENQRDRRNLTSGEIARCIEAVDARQRQGTRNDLLSTDKKSEPSHVETEEIFIHG